MNMFAKPAHRLAGGGSSTSTRLRMGWIAHAHSLAAALVRNVQHGA